MKKFKKWSRSFAPKTVSDALPGNQPVSLQTSIHKPLSDSSFRLLRLLPSRDASAPIRCELFAYPFGNAPPYAALSYTWGDRDSQSSIIINGVKVNAQSNLCSALVRIRLPDNPVALWVDAVCINQSDLSERNAQVSRMRDIYSNATKTIAWLGEDDGHGLLAMDFLNRYFNTLYVLVTESQEHDQEHDESTLLESRRSKAKKAIRDHFYTAEAIPGWNAVVQLLRRPYWQRMWIIQELICAKDIELRCGTATMAFTTLTAFIYTQDSLQGEFMWSVMSDANTISAFRHIFAQTVTANSGVMRIESIRQEYMDKGSVDLARLVLLSAESSASDPRDEVFAILGLAGEAERRAIPIDYRLPFSTVYTAVTKYLLTEQIQVDPSHWLASTNPNCDLEDGLPSWVVDFRAGKRTLPLSPSVYWSGQPGDKRFYTEPQYCASGPQTRDTMEFVFSSNGRVASVKGVIVDTITYIDYEPWDTRHALVPPIARWKAVIGVGDHVPYITGGSKIDALWRTIFLDGTPHILKPGEFAVPRLGSWADAGVEMPLDAPAQEQGLIDMVGGQGDMMKEFRLFVSNQGYIGLVPRISRQGDRIGVLIGAEMPHVLREVEGGYFQLIGECYMHGIMDGKVIDGVSKGKYSYRTVALK